MVARFDFVSVSLALKPKSAGGVSALLKLQCSNLLTDFDLSLGVHEQIIRLDISMDD
jgi:hypothetical protein